MAEPATRREALRILERERAITTELLESLPAKALTTAGLGGGTWSPKDLIGHLATWEGFALDALAAWQEGERAPVDDLLYTVPTSRINDQAVQRKASWSITRVRREAERTHQEPRHDRRHVRRALERADDLEGRKPLGARVGGMLSGARPFEHDASHLKSLSTFVARHALDPRPPA
jgi:hypothetical protein